MKARIYAFDEVDRPDEVARAFTELRQDVINEVEALQTELKGCARRKPEKFRKSKGFVMKNVLLSIAVIGIVLGFGMVAQAQYEKGDISYNVAANPQSLSRYLEDVLNAGYFEFTPMAAPSNNDIVEGKMFYDSSAQAFYYSDDGATWTAFATASGNSLDAAYNTGTSIDVDSTTITLDNDVGDNTVVLTITQDDTTNDPDAVSITSTADAATAVSLQIDSAAGYDIQGTGDVWSIEDSGIGNFVGLVSTTGDVTLTGALYDIIHDASADQLEFQDDAKIVFGTSDDISIAFDGTGGDLNILGTGLEVAFGVSDDGIDVVMHGETASTYALWDESADELSLVLADLKISQGSQIEFVDVTDGLTDWTIDNATDETLLIYPTETTDDQSINLGNATNTSDLRIFGKTASTVVFDSSADEVIFTDYDINLTDAEELRFGTGASGGAGDIKISGSSAPALLIDVVVAGTGSIEIGNDADDVPLTWWGETSASNFILTGDTVLLDGMDMTFEDGDFLKFGDGADFTIDSSTAKRLDIAPAGADELYSVVIGIDQSGVDLLLHGTTAGDKLLWDATDDYLHMIGDKALFTLAEAGAANVFKVDATGAAGSEIDLIVLETSDGGIQLLADGDDEGDIDIDAEDNITITAADSITVTAAGNLSVAVTGTTVFDNMATFTVGYQSTIFDATAAAADGAGNSIPAGTSVCEITAITTNANDWVALPVGVIGEKVTIIATVACELRTLAATDDEINEVDSDGTQEYQLTAGDIVECICVEAGARWTANSHTILGAAKTIVPD